MKKELLEQYIGAKKKVKINLSDKRFFTGQIVSIDNESLIFYDKFGAKILINLAAIAYIADVEDGGYNEANCM